MAATSMGGRIVVRTSRGAVLLRALRAVELEGGWVVPVIADLSALERAGATGGTVSAEFATGTGPVRLDAEIVCRAGIFALRAPGLRPAAMVEQRRENVRAAIALAVRGSVLSAPEHVLEGRTRTVSAGGVAVVVDAAPAQAVAGARMFLEITMPTGDLAPAVAIVVDRQRLKDGLLLRLRFADISPLDSERLVRMVFARQRADLADRRDAATRQP